MPFVIRSVQMEKQGWGIPIFYTYEKKIYFGHTKPDIITTTKLSEAAQFEFAVMAETLIESLEEPSEWRVEEWTQEMLDEFYKEPPNTETNN